jgi:hypothetical protein
MGNSRPNSVNGKQTMSDCAECHRLRAQLELLQRYIVSRRGAEKQWYERCRELERENEKLRNAGAPRKPKKRQVTVELP